MEASADDVQWAQAHFPAEVSPAQDAPQEQGAPQTIFLTMQDIQAMTDRIVAERLAAMDAHYRGQLARVEAEAHALRAQVLQPPFVQPPVVESPVPAQVQVKPRPGRSALSADGSMLLPLRTRAPQVKQVEGAKPATPRNKFFLQDRRTTSNSDFGASDHRGATLSSLTAGSVTNIGVGLQTRELWLNPSLRTPGIGGLI